MLAPRAARPFSATTSAPRRSRVVAGAVQRSREAAAPPALAQLAAAGAAAALLLGGSAGAALAFGPVSVALEDIRVQQVDCEAGNASVGGVTFSGASSKAACLAVSANAINPSGKTLYNADVYGRAYDVNGEALIDDTENIRIAYIDEIPAGSSGVTFRLSVPAEQFNLGPPRLVGLKATGFPGRMLPKTAGDGGRVSAEAAADCEITGDCDDLAAEAAIR
ncbi:hypothetical protein HT031_002260 [Scenedesmus sp. PABB004]|nr:hypothetical protein HT031_002260 [Scenedesmus sp. PABB004]